MRRICIALLVAWVVAAGSAPARAQEAGEGLELRPGAGRSGVGFYTPGEWGLVRSTVINRTGAEQTPLLAIAVQSNRQVQFAKELWLPPNSELTTLTPVRLSMLAPDQERGIEAEAMLILRRDGREVTTRPDIGVLPVRSGGFETAVMAGPDDRTVQMSSALREAAGLQPTTAYISDADAPTLYEALAPIDALVFSRGDAELSEAQTDAIRRWLLGGGRLWLNLQRVSPELARELLGEAWSVAVLDRVKVNDFTLRSTDPRNPRPVEVSLDYPIELVRVWAPDMEVSHEVNGYPAAMRKPVGRGELLVTTLEAPAWLGPENKANDALRALSWFSRQRNDEAAMAAAEDVLGAIANEQIGYRVIGRAPVMAVLVGFTLALVVGGLWFVRRDNLAQMGWVAPLLAVLATGALLGMGLTRQRQVPLTAASAQIVRAVEGQAYAEVAARLSVYTPQADDSARLRGVGPVAWPEFNAGGGTGTSRLVWVGDNGWSYENLALREGSVQSASLRTVAALDEPAEVVATFGPDGLRARVSGGSLGAIEDPVILTPTGKLVLRPAEGEGYVAPYVSTVGPDQFYAGSVLGQREIARQGVYRRMAALPELSDEPLLLGWADGLDLGVAVSEEAQTPRSALVMVPLRFEAPAAGSRVAVPAPLMSMRPYRDEKLLSSPVYDERNRQFVSSNTAQVVMMEFTPPEGLGGLRADSARLVFDLNAPGRPYEVVVLKGGEATAVRSGQDAAGEVVVELSGESMPDVRPDGSVVAGLRVGDAFDPLNSQLWQISRLELGLAGEVPGSARGVEPE